MGLCYSTCCTKTKKKNKIDEEKRPCDTDVVVVLNPAPTSGPQHSAFSSSTPPPTPVWAIGPPTPPILPIVSSPPPPLPPKTSAAAKPVTSVSAAPSPPVPWPVRYPMTSSTLWVNHQQQQPKRRLIMSCPYCCRLMPCRSSTLKPIRESPAELFFSSLPVPRWDPAAPLLASSLPQQVYKNVNQH